MFLILTRIPIPLATLDIPYENVFKMKGKHQGGKEGRKGICYASQNFTFDGIFIFLAPLIFKVTSGEAATPKLLMAARCAPKKNHPH